MFEDHSAGFKKAGDTLQKTADLLGGPRVLRRDIASPLDAHDLLIGGLPAPALSFLINHLRVIQKSASLETAVGMSLRTFQRRKDASTPLNQEQSGRTWKFAEILAKATDVFGGQQQAEEWLENPAIGLDQHRPIDLLSTPAGVRLVEEYLERIGYGVYA